MIDFDKIKVFPAEKANQRHRKEVWIIKNENLKYSRDTFNKILIEKHINWWENNFEKEYIYLVSYNKEIIGYIRLTKERARSMNNNEISIAFLNQYQKKGIGSYSYSIFEKYMKDLDISHIIASTHIENIAGQKFFEKNNYLKKDEEMGYFNYIKNI